MGNINKGTIASISGNTARVVPSDAGAKPTAKITIPWHLRGSTGNLSKGTAVVYVEFDDSTGLLLFCRRMVHGSDIKVYTVSPFY
jgi:hypothetical protein